MQRGRESRSGLARELGLQEGDEGRELWDDGNVPLRCDHSAYTAAHVGQKVPVVHLKWVDFLVPE